MSADVNLKNIFKNTLDLSGWIPFLVRENYIYAGEPIPGLRQEVHHTTVDNVLISAGVFYYNDVFVYVAWGPKEAVHCAFHARLSPQGEVLAVVDGCPDVVPIKDDEGNVRGFILDGNAILKDSPI